METAEMDGNPIYCMIPQDKLSESGFREWIGAVETKALCNAHTVSRTGGDIEDLMPTEHTFTPGLYSRQITMPKNSWCVSRIHIHEHPFVISKGSVSVYDGEKVVTYNAPHIGVTKPGTKRLLFMHEETVWTTFHTTPLKCHKELEEVGVLVCDTFSQFDKIVNKEIAV